MTTKPDPRRRFIDLLETEADAAGCDTATHFARHVAARLDAIGLRITDAPALAEDPLADPRTDDSQPAPGPNAEYHAARQLLHERTSHR